MLKIIDNLLKELFPLNRSITGKDNKKTLQIIQSIIPLKIMNFKSGTKVFDWKIPDEWNIKNAWIKDNKNKKIVDFKKSNLHVMSYSKPIYKNKIKSSQFINKLSYLKNIPNAIPYRTSYYNRDWGFCVTKFQYDLIKNNKNNFELFIDSKFNKNGNMPYGEILIKGKSKTEILLSTYICHPSLANDNLSGIILNTLLAQYLLKKKSLYWSYRIIFIPETIGSIAYIHKNLKAFKKILFGLTITTVGGKGKFGFKKSFDENFFSNALIEETFKELKLKFLKYNFDIHGSDERQFSSQGLKININSITKDKYYEYKEYHNSMDNLDFVYPINIKKSFDLYKTILIKLEKTIIFISTINVGEPFLSKYNLYNHLGGTFNPSNTSFKNLDNVLWIVRLSDGKTPINQIAKKINLSFKNVLNISNMLTKKKILKRI